MFGRPQPTLPRDPCHPRLSTRPTDGQPSSPVAPLPPRVAVCPGLERRWCVEGAGPGAGVEEARLDYVKTSLEKTTSVVLETRGGVGVGRGGRRRVVRPDTGSSPTGETHFRRGRERGSDGGSRGSLRDEVNRGRPVWEGVNRGRPVWGGVGRVDG